MAPRGALVGSSWASERHSAIAECERVEEIRANETFAVWTFGPGDCGCRQLGKSKRDDWSSSCHRDSATMVRAASTQRATDG